MLSRLRAYVWTAVKWTPVAVMTNEAVVTVAPVPDEYMQPTLDGGRRGWREWVLVHVWPIVTDEGLNRGDVGLFKSPFKPSEYTVRRVLAKEGDWIIPGHSNRVLTVNKGRVWIEGDAEHPLEEAISEHATPTLCGPVPRDLARGKVLAVIWPLNRIRLVPNFKPEGRVLLERS
mmetsp:Transcript_46468/g.88723  ORF Transcript_46468/g.88723 Transcript_46468/m.88723 type:complete len:174 (+) Transcript_46468:35-556(+)